MAASIECLQAALWYSMTKHEAPYNQQAAGGCKLCRSRVMAATQGVGLDQLLAEGADRAAEEGGRAPRRTGQ